MLSRLSTFRCLLAATTAVSLGVVVSAPAAIPGSTSPGGGGITIPPPPPLRQFRLWTTDGPQHATDAARAVAAFDQDTIYAAGYITDSVSLGVEQHRWHLRKLRPNGVLVWSVNSPFVGEANALAVGTDGSVVAAGLTNRPGTITTPTFAVAKWNASGVLQWTREIAGVDADGMPRFVGEAKGVALTSNGDVAVVGVLNNLSLDAAGTSNEDQDAVVALLSGSNGVERWRLPIKGMRFAGTDNGTAVAVDPQDRVIAVGSVRNPTSDKDIFITSFLSSGQPWFASRLNITGNANGDDEAISVAVDGQGQIYATGYRTNFGTSALRKDFWVGKFAGNGVSLFQRDLTGSVADSESRGLSVRFDATGNLYASGFTTNTGSPGSPTGAAVASADFTVGKWNALTGTPMWTQKLDGGVNGDDRARSLAVLPSGDLVAGGYLTSAFGGKDFAMRRISATGALGFAFRQDGTQHLEDLCTGVAFDGTGWAVGVGVTRNGIPLYGSPVPTGADFSVAM